MLTASPGYALQYPAVHLVSQSFLAYRFISTEKAQGKAEMKDIAASLSIGLWKYSYAHQIVLYPEY